MGRFDDCATLSDAKKLASDNEMVCITSIENTIEGLVAGECSVTVSHSGPHHPVYVGRDSVFWVSVSLGINRIGYDAVSSEHATLIAVAHSL